jgi:hypothetical protein
MKSYFSFENSFKEKLGSLDQKLFAASCFFAGLTFVVALFFLGKFEPIVGVHPALKPFKFCISTALYLASLSVVLPKVPMSSSTRSVFVWLFIGTMFAEIATICLQPLRGTTSHFNESSALNSFLWNLMAFAITVTTVATLSLGLLATVRSLFEKNGQRTDAVLTFSWRASLWFFAFAAVSGFAMGSKMAHTVGAADGVGTHFAFTNWSKMFGDLRVSHFLSLHALQLFPFTAWLTLKFNLSLSQRWRINILVVALFFLVILFSFVQALQGLPII